MTWPTLNTEGFLITEIAGNWSIRTAAFGDGYSAAKLDGLPEGRRTWTMKISALPGDNSAAPIADDFSAPAFVLRETADRVGYVLAENGGRLILDVAYARAGYLWTFFQASKAAGDRPFWIEMENPELGRRELYLAQFDDDKITYEVLCARVYGTGLNLSERRISGTTSPVPAP
jgi:hypothetical protein